MENNLERIKSLEASREIVVRKLSSAFERTELAERRVLRLEKEMEKARERINGLIEKIDSLTDDLMRIENESAELKKLAHEHKIVM